jgi:hypothetical protein
MYLINNMEVSSDSVIYPWTNWQMIIGSDPNPPWVFMVLKYTRDKERPQKYSDLREEPTRRWQLTAVCTVLSVLSTTGISPKNYTTF